MVPVITESPVDVIELQVSHRDSPDRARNVVALAAPRAVESVDKGRRIAIENGCRCNLLSRRGAGERYG